MDNSSAAAGWPSELEEMEEEARLIHESEWQFEMMRPFNFPTTNSPGSTSKLISFKPKEETGSDPDPDPVDLIQPAPPPARLHRSASGSGAAENVEAERRRRERLNQGFIHLSSLLPDLKKLQARVKSLEEQSLTRGSQSIAYVGRYRSTSSVEYRDTNSSNLLSDDDYGIMSTDSSRDRLPEVETRILNKEVLIKVHCHRNQDMVQRMNEEFSITAKNLVRMLQQSLIQAS
ncbi:hypothetical protein V2J09_001842 [Rumex salicifolius]